MTFWDFANHHPILACILVWMLWICPLTIAYDAWSRYLKSKEIQAHGYPPATEEIADDEDLDKPKRVVEPPARPRPHPGSAL